MSKANIIRAWKQEDYRLGLSEAERATLPPNPAGAIELTDTQLTGIAGGYYVANTCPSVCFCLSLPYFCASLPIVCSFVPLC
jgi:mersacidin/lichenicidin family type 2 lantibiotic